MPRPSPLRRPLTESLPPTVAVVALLLAGPATGSASAKVRHAPCPTAGTTVARDVGPNVRVWHRGARLLACTRRTGERRTVRTLGPWTPRTTVAIGDGNVAFTTGRRSGPPGPADAITAVDVRTGRRWFTSARAALTPNPARPLTDDRVLRLVVGATAAEWVTARGIVNLAVRSFDPRDEYVSDPLPFRVGPRFFLGDAGPDGAAAAARAIGLSVGGESDECGGTDLHRAVVPAIGAVRESVFTYGSGAHPADPDVC